MQQVSQIRNYLLFLLMERNMARPCSLYHLSASYFLPGKEVIYHADAARYEIPVYYDKTVARTGNASYLHLSGMSLD